MVMRMGTKQRKTKQKLSVTIRERGKIPLSRYFQEFKDGDKVNLKLHPNVQFGRFYPRFHGLTGTISGKKGSCYQVTISDKGKEKFLYVHPIHLHQ